MAKLKTETNTPAVMRRVRAAAAQAISGHGTLELDPVFEHGQWWIGCLNCGAQWSVVDQEGGGDVDGFGFERVSEGDESCMDPAA